MVVRKAQLLGDFLDGEGGTFQQCAGKLPLLGQIVMIGRDAVSLFKEMDGPGTGQMYVTRHIVDGKGKG